METGGSKFKGHLWLHTEIQASMRYMRFRKENVGTLSDPPKKPDIVDTAGLKQSGQLAPVALPHETSGYHKIS